MQPAETIEGATPYSYNCNQRWLTSAIDKFDSSVLLVNEINQENFGFSYFKDRAADTDRTGAKSNDKVALIADRL